ncbi:MAG: hypothetical protein FWC27_15025, partial [Firmicutes bacterium]|nr:hypothetical protein [Bacillota bacterium]
MPEHICPTCSGQLRYDPDSQASVCEFCNNSFPIKGTTEANAEVATCTQCGANLQFDPETQATICPSCGHRIEAPVEEISIEPNLIVPFTVSKQKFQETMLDWLASSPSSPPDIFDKIGFESMEAAYLPFKMFKTHVSGYWNASIGYDEERRELERDNSGNPYYRTVTNVRWEPFSSTIDRNFAFPISASDYLKRYELPDYNKNSKFNTLWFLNKFSYPNSCDYDTRYTAGFPVVPFACDPKLGRGVIDRKIEAAIEGMAPSRHISNISWDAHTDVIDAYYAYLPFWFSIYTYKESRQVFMLDGSNNQRVNSHHKFHRGRRGGILYGKRKAVELSPGKI